MIKKECAAVAPIFFTYKDQLTRYIKKRVSDPVDSEEVLSKVLLKVYDHCEKLEDVRNTKAWLTTVTRNVIIDHFKDVQKRRVDTLSDPIMPEQWNEKDDIWSELEACVPKFIQNLPPKYRGPLADYELLGIPQKQLAEKYELSLPGIKSRIQRARSLLRDEFMQHCGHLIQKQADDCGDGACD